MTRWFALASVLALLACGDDNEPAIEDDGTETDNDTAGLSCTPGEVTQCTCSDGGMGIQQCVGGFEMTPCECSDDSTTTTGPETGTTTSGPTTDDSTTTGVSATDGTTGTGSEGTETETATATGTGTGTGGEELCGNGRVEGDEQCDDMNADDDDACSNACIASCGIEWVSVGAAEASIVAGTIDGSGQLATAGLDANGDLVVSRYAPDGNQQWSSTFDVGTDVVIDSVATYADANVIVGGHNETAGSPRIWVIRLDDLGDELWRRYIGGALGGAVATDSQANVIVTGWWEATDDLRLRQYSSVGDAVWTIAIDAGAGLPDRGVAVATSATDDVLVAIEIEDAGNRSVRLRRYGSDGSGPDWSVGPLLSGAGIPASRQVTGLAVDGDGNAMVGISPEGGGDGFWIVSRDDTGASRWTIDADDLAIGGTGRRNTGVGVDADGDVGVLGMTDDGGLGIVTARLGNNGTQLCARTTAPAEVGDDYSANALGVNGAGAMLVGGTVEPTPNPFVARFRE